MLVLRNRVLFQAFVQYILKNAGAYDRVLFQIFVQFLFPPAVLTIAVLPHCY